MKIQKVTDPAFHKYGKVMEGFDLTGYVEMMEHTPVPPDVTYVASVEDLEDLPIATEFQNRGFGGIPIQVGFCNGHNDTLNALEYHRCSEINVAVTDMILLIGSQQDIQSDFTYDTKLVEAFFVPAGTVIEVYATTLHYAPCGVDGAGFRCGVILPKGTNWDLDFTLDDQGEDRLLAAKNKWLIAHKDAEIPGAFCGLVGENIQI